MGTVFVYSEGSNSVNEWVEGQYCFCFIFKKLSMLVYYLTTYLAKKITFGLPIGNIITDCHTCRNKINC